MWLTDTDIMTRMKTTVGKINAPSNTDRPGLPQGIWMVSVSLNSSSWVVLQLCLFRTGVEVTSPLPESSSHWLCKWQLASVLAGLSVLEETMCSSVTDNLSFGQKPEHCFQIPRCRPCPVEVNGFKDGICHYTIRSPPESSLTAFAEAVRIRVLGLDSSPDSTVKILGQDYLSWWNRGRLWNQTKTWNSTGV